MNLQQATRSVFDQLAHALRQLTPEQYMHQGKLLSHSSVGQHTRHIIELFTCLEEGYASGMVNYELRRRDTRIEREKELAIHLLETIADGLVKENKTLSMEAAYGNDTGELMQFETNYYREIAYNLEHTIHHMALIKVGIGEVSGMAVPEGFGVAASTLQYRKSCAQ